MIRLTGCTCAPALTITRSAEPTIETTEHLLKNRHDTVEKHLKMATYLLDFSTIFFGFSRWFLLVTQTHPGSSGLVVQNKSEFWTIGEKRPENPRTEAEVLVASFNPDYGSFSEKREKRKHYKLRESKSWWIWSGMASLNKWNLDKNTCFGGHWWIPTFFGKVGCTSLYRKNSKFAEFPKVKQQKILLKIVKLPERHRWPGY